MSLRRLAFISKMTSRTAKAKAKNAKMAKLSWQPELYPELKLNTWIMKIRYVDCSLTFSFVGDVNFHQGYKRSETQEGQHELRP